MSKYHDPEVKALLKEFRSFQKWAGQGLYSFRGEGDQERAFLEKIHEIVKKYKVRA